MNTIKLKTFNLLFKAGSNVNQLNQIQNRFLPSLIKCRCNSNLAKEREEINSNKSILNLYTIRTHTCGEISNKYLNQTVRLAGWIQYERFNKFFVLRDKYGIVQLVIKDKQLANQFKTKLRLESLIIIEGKVLKRPNGETNESMSNGDIEIEVNKIDLVNECDKSLPINFNELHKTSEDICLKYRFIHLRSNELQRNLQLRSNFIHNIRKFLIDQLKFVEIETPTLFKNTPGGANEYIVPTRFKNKYYTLTQSPQQFKQLLMIGSIDKYFQIARCYRDELTRSDRQPEFTQLDIELSFTNSEYIQQLIEQLLKHTWLKELEDIQIPFKRMKYKDCILMYGIDKPDLRLNFKLNDLSNQLNQIMNETNRKAFSIQINKGRLLDKSILDQIKITIHEKLNHHTKTNKLNCYLIKLKDNQMNVEKIRFNDIDDSVDLDESKKERTEQCDSNDLMILNNLRIENLNNNDYLIICTGELNDLNEIVGKIRNAIIPFILDDKAISETNGLDSQKYSFLWVVDFPLFLKDENNQIDSHHHPFTKPIDEHEEMIYTDPLKVIGQHYDLVLNGNEIGGGSIRIDDYEMQKYVFDNILKSNVNQMNYFLNALKAGCPPHGGIALGLDRLLSIMLETNSIRDVIAFPKTTNGRDLMSDAPNEIDEKSKSFYNLN